MQLMNSQQSSVSFETSDQKAFYTLKTPSQMWGKSYLITVQAINKERKMSLLSDPVEFSIPNGAS